MRLPHNWVILAFICISLITKSQVDTIKLINGTRIPSKIVEVTKKNVVYKNPKDTLGQNYYVPLKIVESIIFKNGCYEPLNQMGYKDCVKDPLYGVIKNEDFTRHIISFDLLQVFNFHLQAGFVSIAKNRKLGLGSFYNYGLNYDDDEATYKRIESRIIGQPFYKRWYTGIDLYFFPTIHKRTIHWMALGIDYGSATFKQTVTDTIFYNGSHYYFGNPRNAFVNRQYYGYHFNNGFLYRKSRHMIMQGVLSIGANQFVMDLKQKGFTNKYYLGIKIGIGFSLGYAF